MARMTLSFLFGSPESLKDDACIGLHSQYMKQHIIKMLETIEN